MSGLKDQLVQWANLAQDLAWSRFNVITKHAGAFGLTPADVDRWANPGEPSFVAHLVSDDANLFLRRAIAGHTVAPWRPDSVAVSSVFIHQKPKIDFGSGQIEIGDLLLVRQHFITGNPLPQGSAFLLQAKTSSSPATGKLKGNEATQFKLYRDWPTFTFPAYPTWLPSGAPRWDFSGARDADRTGTYGVVYPKELKYLTSVRRKVPFADDCAWGVGTRTHFGSRGGFGMVDASKLSLGAFMEGFISGQFGRPWSVHRPDHWSQFVLQIMARATDEKWTFPIQRAQIHAKPRLQVSEPLKLSLAWATNSSNSGQLNSRDGLDSARAAGDWLRSTRDRDVGGPPPDDVLPVPPAPGGLSMVYIGTFGDRPLDGLPQG